MLKTNVTFMTNLASGVKYRHTESRGLEFQCMLTKEWVPSSAEYEKILSQSSSYTVTVETKWGRIVRKVTTMTLSLRRFLEGLRRV